MSTTRKIANKNVTSGPLSRSERHEISLLCVKFERRSHGNFDSAVWNYFGELAIRSSDASSASSSTSAEVDMAVIDSDRRYCNVCLQREQGLYSGDSSGRTGHISRVKSYSKSTSTGCMADHLFTAHNVCVRERESGSGSGPKQKSLQETFAMAAARNSSGRENLKPASSAYEFNRDLCLMLCVDLLPFPTVSNKGFSRFCAKNLPSMQMPRYRL